MVLELFADSSKLLEKLADVNQNFLKYVPIVFKQRHFMKLNFFLQCTIQGGRLESLGSTCLEVQGVCG